MVRQAFRSLLRSRGFAALSIAIIAVGIAVNTIVFSVVDAVLLRRLPFRNESRLYTLSKSNPKRSIREGPFSYPAFVELRERDRMFEGLAALTRESFNWSRPDRPEQLPGARVSASFFDVVGLDVAVGRRFVPADDAPGGAAVVVLGRNFWMREFNGNPRVTDLTLKLNGMSYAVAGALGIDLPPPFDGVDIWATRVDEITGFAPSLIRGGLGYLTAVGRLRTDVWRTEAQAEVDTISRGYARANPTNTDADADASLAIVPLRQRSAADVRAPLLVLMGAVAIVLLIACANLASLVLLRGTARATEAAIRVSLGARRVDLLRWLIAETAVLALAGGGAGVVLALWGISAAGTALTTLPRSATIAVDPRVLVFSAAATVGSLLLFGVVPSLILVRRSTVDQLRGAGRVSSPPRRSVGRALVIAEIALSLILLVAAGLLLQSVVRLTNVSVGLKADGLVTMRVSLPSPKYLDPSTMRTFANRLLVRLDATAGIERAALAASVPPVVTTMAPYIQGDVPFVGIGERPVGEWTAVSPSYFVTMGIPFVSGRALSEGDDENAPLVVVVSKGLADRAWPGQSAIGKKLLVGRFPGFADVVGVVADVKNAGLMAAPLPEMYTPYAQRPWPAFGLVVRSAAGIQIVTRVRAALAEIDPDLPVTQVQTVDAAFSDSIATTRLITTLLTIFAAIAMTMAAAGLYGVIAYAVERRRREIGVRMALGAAPGAVVGMVARETLPLIIIGVGAGTTGAAATSGLIRSQLYEVSAVDPITYAVVVVGFVFVAVLACVVPVRRALRVDPLESLRAE
jgi:predicted permease